MKSLLFVCLCVSLTQAACLFSSSERDESLSVFGENNSDASVDARDGSKDAQDELEDVPDEPADVRDEVKDIPDVQDECFAILGVSCDSFDEAYIKASNAGTGDFFGYALSLSGDTLAVGAYNESSNGIQGDDSLNNSGAVYVFERKQNGWVQTAYLKASNPGTEDSFGHALSLSGDTLAVGAYGEGSSATGINGSQDNDDVSASGAVYVFTRNNGQWAQQAYIKASNTGKDDSFGYAVSLDEDTLAVGAYGESSAATGIDGDQSANSKTNSGAVYVFTRNNGQWAQQAYIKASNPDMGDQFGFVVDLEQDTLVVGANLEDSAATGIDGDQSDDSRKNSGAVYVFTRNNGQWAQQAYIKPSQTEAEDFFGKHLSLDGDALAVGADGRGQAQGQGLGNTGGVYVFRRDQQGWTQEVFIAPTIFSLNDYFGNAVALEGDLLAVGAYNEGGGSEGIAGDARDNSRLSSGAVYLWERKSNGSWSQKAYIKSSNTDANDFFGEALTMERGRLVVGAPGEDSNDQRINGNQRSNSAGESGAVYVRRIAPQ